MQRLEDAGLARALTPTGAFVIVMDDRGQVVWAVNVPPAWSTRPLEGCLPTDFLPKDAAAQVDTAIASAIESARPSWVEVPISDANVTKWYALWIDANAGRDGEPAGLVLTGLDVSEQKQREQTLRTLLREVSHRSKNLLAIIQSIATQTGRHTETVDDFLARFRGRIQSMASTQDLVTSSNWRGAELRELALSQIGRYVADPAVSVRLSGERPYLTPNAALHVGLALHELAVNSVSYGALSGPDGSIALDCSQVGEKPSEDLLLRWTETISIADGEMGQKRFGSTALERVVPAALGSVAELIIENDRLIYWIRIPSGNFELG